MSTAKRVALYARVSTLDQHPENQLVELRAYAKARGFENVVEYIDHGVSGAKDRRPALDKLMADVKCRRVDLIAVTALDRLGRSVRHLLQCVETFRHVGAALVSLREGVSTERDSPVADMVIHVFSAVAEVERRLLIERVRSGLKRAREAGVRLGRAPIKVDPHRLKSVINRKLSARQAAKELGCSTASAWRLIRAHRVGAVEADRASRAAEETVHDA
jgi:DNA invertase Pin-like site-specific DNA recombinase